MVSRHMRTEREEQSKANVKAKHAHEKETNRRCDAPRPPVAGMPPMTSRKAAHPQDKSILRNLALELHTLYLQLFGMCPFDFMHATRASTAFTCQDNHHKSRHVWFLTFVRHLKTKRAISR